MRILAVLPLLLGTVMFSANLFAEAGWTKSSYTVSDWVEPSGRLKPKTGTSEWFDGNPTTFTQYASLSTNTTTLTTPRDIETIQILVMDNGKAECVNYAWSVEMMSVSVKYEGDDDFTELPNSYVKYSENVPGGTKGTGKLLVFSDPDGFVAKRVTAIRIANGTWQNYWAIGYGELVFTGEDSVEESLSAEYLAAAGQYSAKVSAIAADYPLDVYFCRGETDGGTTIADWDVVTKVGTIASSDDCLQVNGTTDFAYCRFYFTSPRYGDVVWSNGLIVDNNPAVIASVGERHTDKVSMIAKVQSPGASSASCDVYFAYAVAGEEFPAVSLVKAGVSVGETVTNVVTALSPGFDYVYKFVVRNAQSGETTVNGTFSSLSAGAWQLSPFESASEYSFPENWLPNPYSSGAVNCSGAGNTGVGTDLGFTFTAPKDITRIDIYTYNVGRKNLGFANLQVKYDGSDNYVELPGTALAYRSDVGNTGIRFSFIASEPGGIKNVLSVKVPVSQVHNGSTAVAGRDCVGYPSGYTGEYKWDFSFADVDNFQLPTDVITDATTTGIDAKEKDGDITTVKERGNKYGPYVWNFNKTMDITSVGIFSNSSDSNNRTFSVASISVKYRGDSEYTELPGITFSYFNRGSNVVAAVLRPIGSHVAKNVKSVKLMCGEKYPGWVNVKMAEVYVAGHETKGLKVILR